MAFLASQCRPISLTELLAVRRGEARLEPRSVLVTFDDGYVDKNLLVNLMAVPDPGNVGGLGAFFTFPFVTIEDVEIGRLGVRELVVQQR